jgi:hypothetical protein
MRDQLRDACALCHVWEVELHVCGVLLELVEKLLRRRAHDVMDLDNLVELIVAGEEREKRQNFEQDATNTPQIHLVTVVPVGEQALGGTIPPCRDVFGIRLLRVDAST